VFADCCADQLPNDTLGNRAREARSKGDWAALLLASRADATEYTILHRSHTEPILQRDSSAIPQFLQIDINALGEIVSEICFAFWRMDRQSEIPVNLERLRSNIKSEKWQRKITYYQALTALVGGDASKARSEFEKLGPITADEEDVEILELYLDLYGKEFSFSRMIEVCDQILMLSKSIGNILQYNAMKAFSYAAIGDLAQARNTLAVASAEARRREEVKPLSIRAKVLFAGVLTFQGAFGGKQAAFDEAISLYRELLSDTDAWAPKGIAQIQSEFGECLRFVGRWSEAETAYRAALAAHPTGIANVFLAECLVRQNEFKAAVDVFDAVDRVLLSDEEKMDHAYTAAIIAVEAKDVERMKAAIELLKSDKASAPYFEERRLNLIVQLQEAVAEGKPSGLMRSIGKLLRQPLKTLSRYGILQPTVFGIGLNINAIIDDSEEISPRKGRPRNGDTT
jgi:tetratricopeptide (TPR) repeat protein